MKKGDLIKIKSRNAHCIQLSPSHIREMAGCEGLLLKTYPNMALMWIVLVKGTKQFVWPDLIEKVCALED